MHNTTRIVQSIASSVVGYLELSRPFRPVLLLLGLHMDWLQVRLLLGVPLLLLFVGACLIRLVFLLLILLTLGLLLCMLLLLFWLRLLLRLISRFFLRFLLRLGRMLLLLRFLLLVLAGERWHADSQEQKHRCRTDSSN